METKMDLTIAEIAAACGGRLYGDTDGDAQVTSVALDSRLVTPGGVFIATVGERVDGHSFIAQVLEKGALLVICEREPQDLIREYRLPEGKGTFLWVEDSFRALREIAEAYRKKLSIPIVGITGSVGKTSTKEFVAGVLAQKYRVLKTEGNYNNEIGVPLTLLRIRREHTAAVIEMGISDFGEMHRLSKMARPTVCVITNIGQCHLENLKTRDGILQAKTEIFDFMAPDGAVVLNGEDDKLSALLTVKDGMVEPYFYGMGGNDKESVYAQEIRENGFLGSDAVLCLRKRAEPDAITRQKIHVPLPGLHMVGNAAAAACVAMLLGLDAAQIAEGIRTVEATSGRGRVVRTERYTLIDDCYNANPVSMKAALELLAMADTAKIAILGDMFELGENAAALHAQVGAYAAQCGIDRILCVGELAEHMYEAAKAGAGDGQIVTYYPDRAAFLELLSGEDFLPPGSTVLMKASHGMHFEECFQILRGDTKAES